MVTHKKALSNCRKRRLSSLFANGLVVPIKAYQYLLSPWLGQNCRFNPTCSQYAIAAIRQYGAGKGALLALKRLGKCHPWHPGGEDPLRVPKQIISDADQYPERRL